MSAGAGNAGTPCSTSSWPTPREGESRRSGLPSRYDTAMDANGYRQRLPEELASALHQFLGDRFTTSESVRALHGRDESPYPPVAPWAVVFPESTAEVQKIVAACATHRVPMIPFGAGSSLEGHVLPIQGGISIDLTGMNQVRALHPEDFDVVVEPGVTRLELERVLGDLGLFFPVDPGADATLGGMVATGASGTTTVRYGAMRENVLALEVVLADGSVIRTGSRARKSSAGYDLTRLFIGSEGTLGIVTEITLRVHGIPEAIANAVCSFPDLAGAVEAAIEIIQWGVPVARVELLDEVQMDAVNRHSGLNYPPRPTLFFEFHGSPAEVEAHAASTGRICAERGGCGFDSSSDTATRAKLWRARHEAYFACQALRPNARVMSTDVCVPISRLAECILETKDDIARVSFPAPIVGHVGDGNFHLLMAIRPDSPTELDEANRLNQALVHRALAMGGTCSGEHGIGIGKLKYMHSQHGPAVATMRAIKKTLDPHGLMNPGKVLPPRSQEES